MQRSSYDAPVFLDPLASSIRTVAIGPRGLGNDVMDEDSKVGLRELKGLVRRNGPLSPERTVRIVRRAARAFAEVSEKRRPSESNQVFSFGVALFYALTGMAPHEAQRSSSMSAPPAPSDFSPHAVPPSLDAVVRTCLANRPSDRFSSPLELSVALGALSLSNARLDQGHSFDRAA